MDLHPVVSYLLGAGVAYNASPVLGKGFVATPGHAVLSLLYLRAIAKKWERNQAAL